VSPNRSASGTRTRWPWHQATCGAVPWKEATKTPRRPPADGSMVGGKQTIEALPPEILRDPSTVDSLQSLMACLSALDHLPTLDVRTTARRKGGSLNPKQNPSWSNFYLWWHCRRGFLGGQREQGNMIGRRRRRDQRGRTTGIRAGT
jgi:hypothetical protein